MFSDYGSHLPFYLFKKIFAFQLLVNHIMHSSQMFLFVVGEKRQSLGGSELLKFGFVFPVPESGGHSYYYSHVFSLLAQLQRSVPVRHILGGEENGNLMGVGSTSVM